MKKILLVLALTSLAASALAQNGDKAGEEQPSLVPADKIPPAPVLSPAEALKSFRLPPGFKIETVAADPLVHDPVEAMFDPDGRLWVLEMRGYMPTPDGVGEDQKVGSIAVLEDTDGDGVMDKRTEFASGLVMPRAFMLVRGWALVAEPPKLWFMRDTDGDGKADEKVEVAGDYARQADPTIGPRANPEHASNSLRWMMDNWIYSANHDTRFRNVDGRWLREPTRERGQWGLSQDDFGRLVYNSNSDQLRYDLVPSGYLDRNPNYKGSAGINYAPVKDQAVWPARVNPGVNRGYRREQLRADGTLATFTAACAPYVYRGDQFPPEFKGHVFLCEPSANLVRDNRMTSSNGWLYATNAWGNQEFLASMDERFRPVNLFGGPDGALYVVDLYRGIIQHRIFLTSYLRKQSESRGLEKPIGLGRIYRVTSDAPRRKEPVKLSTSTTRDLVELLAYPNGWQRDTAQRLLVERRDEVAVPLLRKMIATNTNALARLHALWTLDGMGRMNVPTIVQALPDEDAQVKIAALRVSELYTRAGAKGEILPVALSQLNDSRPEVQTQLAFTLGEIRDAKSEEALLQIAGVHADHALVLDAIMSGLKGRELEFATNAIASPALSEATKGRRRLFSALAQAVFIEGVEDRLAKVLEIAANLTDSKSWQRDALLEGINANLPTGSKGRPAPIVRKKKLNAEPAGLTKLHQVADPAVAKLVAGVDQLITWPGKAGEAAERAVKPLNAAQKERFEQGKTLYLASCGACHQPHGKGQEGLAPPLVDSEWALGSEQRAIRIVMHGVRGAITVKGKVYSLDMPGLWVFDDNQISSILTYVRREWGHEADPVEPETVAKVRADTSKRNEGFTEPELLQIP